MVAPTNNPVVSSVPLYGPSYLLGETTNQFQPLKSSTWNVVIPSPLLGTEVIAGYACFTTDGASVLNSGSGFTLANLVGFAENQYFNEWDVGSLTGSDTLGDYFTISVCEIGTIYVYNSTAIVTTISSGAKIVLTVTGGTTPAAIKLGSLIQGSDPAGSTTLDVSTVVKIRTANSTGGGGVLVDILKSA